MQWGRHSPGQVFQHALRQTHTPWTDTPETATAVDGTDPTGMHSRLIRYRTVGYKLYYNFVSFSVFDTMGNVLSGIVMTQKSMSSNTMALMLTVLGVVDTLVLWVDMFRQYLKKIHDIDLRSFSNTSCKLHR